MEMAFGEEEIKDFKGFGAVKHNAHVGIGDAGEIIGWDSIWKLLESEDREQEELKNNVEIFAAK